MKKTVALIFGGEGCEREISMLSAENLASLTDRELYSVLYIGIDRGGSWYLYSGEEEKIGTGLWQDEGKLLRPTFPVRLAGKSGFISDGKIICVDCAIPCLHGDLGEDGVIQGALAAAHIPYIGQDVYASAVTSDKIYTKLCAEALGIPTARWLFSNGESADSAKRRAETEIGYPLFIKPARQGSSYGAHPVRAADEFIAAYEDSVRFGTRLLIEELIPVEYELECALLDTGERLISPHGIILSGGKFYDFGAKYSGKDSPETNTDGSGRADIHARVTEYTERLADLIGVTHLSRFDYFITHDGKIYFNEINAFPGMTKTSLYPKLTENMGLRRGDFINALIRVACENDRRI